VIIMVGIVEQLAARCLQVVNPGQPVTIDKIGIESKSTD
jgi:hypothetical protein